MLSESNKNIFKNKDFMLLWLGQLVSLLGNNMHSLAVMWYVLEKTGSTVKTGITLVFTVLPMVLLSPITGALADRWDRKKIIVISDFVNGVLVGIIFLLIHMNSLEIWMLYLLSAFMSVSKAFFGPAIGAAVPSIVKKDNLIKANSLTQMTRYGTSIFGPIIGGVFIALIGIPGLFLLDSISYILSSISECFIKIPKINEKKDDNETSASILDDIKEGVEFALKNKELLHFIIVGGFIINFFLAPLSMTITVFSRDILKLGSEGAGILLGAIGIGGLIISFLTPIINKKVGHYTLTFIGLTCEGISLILFSLSTNFYAAIASLFLMGLSVGICNISLSTVFQTLIPNHMMGRVGSSLGIITGITPPLGIFLAGILLERFSIPNITLISGIAVTIAGFSTVKAVKKSEAMEKEII